jgi:hypothetical protein
MIFYMTVMTIFQFKEYKRELKPTYKAWETNPIVLLKNFGKLSLEIIEIGF